jgi:putative ABC transport system permease protein
MPDNGFLLAAALPERLGDEVARIDGVRRVDRIAFLPARVNGQSALVMARTFTPGEPLPLDLRGGDARALEAGLRSGEAVLGVALAQKLGVGAGDRVALATARGPVSLRVAGTVAEYAVGGQVVYLEWETARRLLPVAGAHIFLVSAEPGATEQAGEGLRGFCEGHGLLLQSNADLREFIDRLLSRVAAVLWALIALAFVVAALGIVNTLSMNVLEQARAFGILRALGMTRRQVGASVLCQGALLGLLSALPAAAVGVGTAYLLNRASGGLFGQQATFRVAWPQVAGCVGLALGFSLLAAALPAWRSARLPVVRALRG